MDSFLIDSTYQIESRSDNNLNNLIISKEIEALIKSLPSKNKAQHNKTKQNRKQNKKKKENEKKRKENISCYELFISWNMPNAYSYIELYTYITVK